jgi:F-type H+-transporting ATPase subunit b
VELRFDVLVTQIIGFLIVLWVLRRYAWGPVLGMLEERRLRIANEVAGAERLRQEAMALKAEYESQLRTIEVQARERIQKAVIEGQKVADEIRAKAQAEARVAADKTRANLELDFKKARVELREEIIGLALGAAERLLQERLDAKEHGQVVERFLRELEADQAR